MFNLRSWMVAGGALVGLAGLSTSASALTMQAVYMGTVNSGHDATNQFGLGTDADLTGLDFTATFLYDPSTLGAYFDSYDDGVTAYNYVCGGPGSGCGGPSPMLSATIEIGSGSFSFDGNYYSLVQIYQYDDVAPNGYTEVYHYASDYQDQYGLDGNGNYFEDYQNSFLYPYIFQPLLSAPLDLETPYSVLLAGGGGSFQANGANVACQSGYDDCAATN